MDYIYKFFCFMKGFLQVIFIYSTLTIYRERYFVKQIRSI
jgi:hypothetical protein